MNGEARDNPNDVKSPDNPDHAPIAPEQLRVLQIVWAVFLGNHGIFAVLLYVVVQGAAQEHAVSAGSELVVGIGDPEVAATLLPIFFAIAVAAAGLSIFVIPDFAVKQRMHLYTATLLGFASAEVVAILGLLYGFLGGEMAYALVLIGLSAALIFIQCPTAEHARRYAERLGRAPSR